jgi:hypothetical protein
LKFVQWTVSLLLEFAAQKSRVEKKVAKTICL